MAAGKPAPGSTHGPGGPWPCGLMDTGKQAQGTTRSRVADTHGPSWARGNDEKDASLGGKACGHRVGSIPGSDGKVHRFEGRARPCALIDAPIRRRAPTIPEEGRRLGALRYRHRREGRTRSPRCATRSERWASGFAVKGRPLSGEGCERQGQRPGRRRASRLARAPQARARAVRSCPPGRRGPQRPVQSVNGAPGLKCR